MEKLNHFLLRVGRRLELKRVWAYPETLQLVPTNACNLRCKNCPKTHYSSDNRHLSPEVYKRAKEDLFRNIRVLNLQGLGEPLLAPLFPQMIDDAENYGLKIIFVTNATTLDKVMIEKLVQIGATITISLDGARPETHEMSRPGSKFSQLMEAFELFKEEKQKQVNSDFVLNINTVVNTMNVNEVEGIIDIAGRYNVKCVNLINPAIGERNDEFAKIAIGNHPELLSSQIHYLIKKAISIGVHLSFPDFILKFCNSSKSDNKDSSPDYKREERRDNRLFPGKCFDPWNKIYIDVDGWVRPCCRAIWLGMGNILENSFWEIWNNEHYRGLRGSINTNNPPDFCRNCNMNTGINRGDEFYIEKLKQRGIQLPDPPLIGIRGIQENK